MADRAAMRRAVFRLAHAEGWKDTAEALDHVIETAEAWKEGLVEPRIAEWNETTLRDAINRALGPKALA
jgi:hypothetical protein